MNRQRAKILLGAAVAVLLVAVAGKAVMSGSDDQDHTITTVLDDAGSLEEGNEVRVAGVRVGEIKSIELDGRDATVTLDVDPMVLPLHQDATLKVRPVNLLGENYVSVDAGSSESPFMDKQVIPTDQTETAVTIQDVLNTFHAPTAASLASVVTALGEGLDGNGGNVSKVLKELAPTFQGLEDVGGVLEDQNKVLNELIVALDPVAASLADDRGRTLDRLVESARDTLRAVTAQQDALRSTITQLPGTLASAQRTLAEFGGVADEAVPTLKSLRPLTGDLSQVIDELEDFADSADPALASLRPVMERADALLDQAAPIVEGLRGAGPDLRRVAASLKPVSRELLDENLYGVMEFVRKWALSTNGRDGLSHYFRGVVYVTPTTLNSIAASLVPTAIDLPGGDPGNPDIPLPGLHLPQIPHIPIPDLPNLSNLPSSLNNLLGGGRQGRGASGPDPTSALGLTSQQEQNLLGQLLGGEQ